MLHPKLAGLTRAAPAVLSMPFTSKFTYVLFCNPPIKLKLGQLIGGGLLIGSQPDE